MDDPIDAEEGGDVPTLAQAPYCTVDPRAGAVLAERLGHLPLALALAAAYMRACDVSCTRYLRRLEASSGAEI